MLNRLRRMISGKQTKTVTLSPEKYEPLYSLANNNFIAMQKKIKAFEDENSRDGEICSENCTKTETNNIIQLKKLLVSDKTSDQDFMCQFLDLFVSEDSTITNKSNIGQDIKETLIDDLKKAKKLIVRYIQQESSFLELFSFDRAKMANEFLFMNCKEEGMNLASTYIYLRSCAYQKQDFIISLLPTALSAFALYINDPFQPNAFLKRDVCYSAFALGCFTLVNLVRLYDWCAHYEPELNLYFRSVDSMIIKQQTTESGKSK